MSQNWAICIGIDRYDNLRPLHFARRGADALRDFFEKEVGFERVYFFAEDTPPIPTDFGEPIRSSPTGAPSEGFCGSGSNTNSRSRAANCGSFSPDTADASATATL